MSMDFVLTKHARQRKNEYRITVSLIRETLRMPDQVRYDGDGYLMFKKLYVREGHPHVLIVVCVRSGKTFRIITLITSSKVKKYLS